MTVGHEKYTAIVIHSKNEILRLSLYGGLTAVAMVGENFGINTVAVVIRRIILSMLNG